MSALHTLLSSLHQLLLSLASPARVRTNQSSGLIRLIACVCMVVDHAGKMCFPDQPWMRLIGRLAFPLFAYGISVGVVYTRDPLAYLRRIVLLALISQPLYALGLGHENSAMYAVSFMEHPLRAAYTFYIKSFVTPSILLSLAAGLALLICLRRRQWILALFMYVLCERFSGSLDYGMFGIRLMLLFYVLCEYPLAAAVSVFIYMIANSAGYGYVFFGHEFSMRIFALPAALFACIPLRIPLRLPKWFGYGFYPAHLAVLALIVKLT